MKSEAAPLVELRGVSKSYPGVRALTDVTLGLWPGTITALAGENGAGKSTFIKVLSGAERADTGEVLLQGQQLDANPGAVIDAGVSVIYQELTDIPDMSIVDNVLLGRLNNTSGFTRRARNRRQARVALDKVGLGHLDLDQPIRTLSLSQRQLIEIARCLSRDAKVLVFDEPTSSLPESEVHALLSTIQALRESGLAILYVSHHLDELFQIADRITVLRDGQLVADRPTSQWADNELVQTMLAKDLEHAYPWEPRTIGKARLEVRDLGAPGVKSATLNAGSGEIVGIVGLAGAGRTELMKSIAGIERRSSGVVTVDGSALFNGSIQNARSRGVVYAPEDRKVEGLVLQASVAENLSYGLYERFSRAGWLQRRKKRNFANALVQKFGVRADSTQQIIGRLSGGNQQKVVLARVAASEPAVVLLDDPTRGVDVGAKSSIYRHVLDLAREGTSVLLTSSDTDEVLAMSDRAYVMRSGRIVAEVNRSEFDRERMLHLAAVG